MLDKIIFRKVNPNEIELYHIIRLECLKNHPENFGTLYEEELCSSSFKFDKIIAQIDSTDFLMGAFIDKTLIGTCGFIQEKRIKTKHAGELSQMYISTEYRGYKIAAGLLQATIKTAFQNPFLEQIILAVSDRNEAAKNLYNKNNFKEYGRLNNYFKYSNEYETQVFMVLVKTLTPVQS